jgi:hypothetical protein
MSDVTGSIGNENVRLRGMALEETQLLLLRELEEFNDNNKRQTGYAGLSPAEKKKRQATEDATAALNRKTNVTNRANDAVKNSGGALGKMSGIIDKAGDKIKGSLDTFGRTIRGYDSSIRDTSFAMKQLSYGSKGAMASMAKLSAESISQLEEQFDVYKKLSNIGGVTATDFENMRINASQFGVTMQEYAGLMESNFINLRLSGKSAGAAMKDVSRSTRDMREQGDEYTNQLMALGIGQSDYGQLILENTMLMGGFGKAISSAEPFAERILNATKNVTALSDAFGFNREQVMKQANDAMKDARDRTIFKSIQSKGKEDLLKVMTGILGDGKKGMDMTLSLLTGQFSADAANLASFAPDLMDSFKLFTQYLNKAPGDLEGALKFSNMDQAIQRIDSNSLAMAQATRFSTDASANSVQALLNLKDMYGDSTKAGQRFSERLKGLNTEGANQLKTLDKLQGENIRMSLLFADTNKSLNNFGLTVGFAMQVMTEAMANLSKGTVKSMDQLLKDLGGYDFVKQMTKEGHELNKSLKDTIGKDVSEFLEEATGGKSTGRKPNAAEMRNMPIHGSIADDAMVNVQGTMVPISKMDQAGKEATAGGATPLYLKQLLAAIVKTNPDIKVNAAQDAYHGGAHAMSLDIGLAKGRSQSVQFAEQVRNMMAEYGLGGSDYKVINEYTNPSANATGGHMHVEMTAEGAKKFYDNYQKKNSTPSSATSPVSTPPKPVAPAKVGAAQNNSQSTVTASVASSGSGATDTLNNTIGQSTIAMVDPAFVEQLMEVFKNEGTLSRKQIETSFGTLVSTWQRSGQSTT